MANADFAAWFAAARVSRKEAMQAVADSVDEGAVSDGAAIEAIVVAAQDAKQWWP